MKRDELLQRIARCEREAAACAANGAKPGLTPEESLGATQGECDWLAAKQHFEEELEALDSPAVEGVADFSNIMSASEEGKI